MKILNDGSITSSTSLNRLPLEEQDPFDSTLPVSQLFTPQLIGIGSATGDIIVSNSKIYELIDGHLKTTWLERLGIFSRRFLPPDIPLETLATRAVVALLLNHLVWLSHEEFCEQVRNLFPAIGLELTTSVTRKTRIKLLRTAYSDTEIACAIGSLVLSKTEALVVSSSTFQDLLAPLAGAIQADLRTYGLPAGIPSQTLNNVCAGCGFAVDVADGYLRKGYQQVLVIILDAYSKILNIQRHDTAPLFGDQAAAMLFSRPVPKRSVHGLDLRIIPYIGGWTGGEINSFISRPMIEGYPFFEMNPKTVAAFSGHIATVIKEYLARIGLSLDSIDLIVPHQPQKEIIRALAKSLGVNYIANIRPDGYGVLEETGYGQIGVSTKIVWIGGEIGNGAAAASPTALNLALSAIDQKTGERLVPSQQAKPVFILLVGFGGGANIYVMVTVAQAPGCSWSINENQAFLARKGILVPVAQPKDSLDVSALLLNAATASRAPYPALPREVVLSHRLEHLQRRGEAWNHAPAKPYSFAHVAIVGFGQRGVDKAVEISRMPDNQEIHVFTRSHQRFQDTLYNLQFRYRENIYKRLCHRVIWHSIDNLEQVLLQNSKIRLLFEVAPEKEKLNIFSRAWSAHLGIKIITNTSSQNIRHIAKDAAEIVAQRMCIKQVKNFVDRQIRSVIVQHDHRPNTNKLDNISDPQKRPIDPRLYASVKAFCLLNGKVIDFVDDKYPMYAGNRIVFGGLLREVFRLLTQEGYSPLAIRKAALANEGWKSPHYCIALPALGFDPLQLADEVGLDITRDVLENYDKYYGSGSGILNVEHFGFLLAYTDNAHTPIKHGIYQWETLNNKLCLKTEGDKPLLSETTATQIKVPYEIMTFEEKVSLRERLWLALMAEYFRLIDDEVLRHPRYGDFELSWFAINKATGGALQLADDLSLPELVNRMTLLAQEPGQSYFAPTLKVCKMSETGKLFETEFGWPSNTASRGTSTKYLTWFEEYQRNASEYSKVEDGTDLYWGQVATLL
jgi:3-oxoacyl-[acyl-carrier-protein] synthase III